METVESRPPFISADLCRFNPPPLPRSTLYIAARGSSVSQQSFGTFAEESTRANNSDTPPPLILTSVCLFAGLRLLRKAAGSRRGGVNTIPTLRSLFAESVCVLDPAVRIIEPIPPRSTLAMRSRVTGFDPSRQTSSAWRAKRCEGDHGTRKRKARRGLFYLEGERERGKKLNK